MPADIFLTGATGFIGSGLLKTWLDRSDARLHLLVRGGHDADPKNRIERILDGLYPDGRTFGPASRIEILEGDLALDNLGLNDIVYERCQQNITHIVHCAAAARFDLEIDEARRINVGGTEKVLALAQRCPRLKKFDYIGTAYVAGRREGIVGEDELDEGQEHNNTYERSKLEAEQLAREYWTHLPMTIFRPSIVICDAATGRISRHSAFYRVLRMYQQGQLKILPGDPDALLDLVPLDYCTDATYAISKEISSPGRCYHLTAGSDNLTSLGEIRDLAAHHFGQEPFAIVSPEEFKASLAQAQSTLSEETQKMIDEINLYLPYLTGRLRFDHGNTLSLLRDRAIEVPHVASYFHKMAEYMSKQIYF